MTPATRIVDACTGLAAGIVIACIAFDSLDERESWCPLCRVFQWAGRHTAQRQQDRARTVDHRDEIARQRAKHPVDWIVERAVF